MARKHKPTADTPRQWLALNALTRVHGVNSSVNQVAQQQHYTNPAYAYTVKLSDSNQCLPRDAKRRRATSRPLSCPSHSSIVSQQLKLSSNFSRLCSPIISSFVLIWRYKILRGIPWNPPGATHTRVVKIRTFRPISLYQKWTRYRHSYYGTFLRSRMFSFSLCHFQI